MTAPRFADCKCGHNKMSHEVEAKPRCVHEGCGCEGYRPTVSGLRPEPSSTDQVIAKGKRSDSKSIANLAAKIEEQIGKLRDRLAEDSEAAKLRAEAADLEQRLAAVKAKLRGQAPTIAASLNCPEPNCDRTFTSGQAVAMHRRRAHEGYDPNAERAAS